ncbi:MAG TPA: hypothetical protein PKG62_05710, partial [Methanothrix soehngenii]|nr:hypothetical protein [Methanothrix soehngenii]
ELKIRRLWLAGVARVLPRRWSRRTRWRQMFADCIRWGGRIIVLGMRKGTGARVRPRICPLARAGRKGH